MKRCVSPCSPITSKKDGRAWISSPRCCSIGSSREHAATMEATLDSTVASKAAVAGVGQQLAFGVDRVAGRLWDYPRFASDAPRIASISSMLSITVMRSWCTSCPADRTLVTLPRSRYVPERSRTRARATECRVPRDDAADSRRPAQGGSCRLRYRSDTDAAHRRARSAESRTSVVHNGLHPSFSPLTKPPRSRSGAPAGSRASIDILHVGSAIARKRHRCVDPDHGGTRTAACAWCVSAEPFTARAIRPRPRSRRDGRRAAISRPRHARRHLSTQRAAGDAIRTRRFRPAAGRIAGVRDAGRRQRHCRPAGGRRRRGDLLCGRRRRGLESDAIGGAARRARTSGRLNGRHGRNAAFARAEAFSWSKYAGEIAVAVRAASRTGRRQPC